MQHSKLTNMSFFFKQMFYTFWNQIFKNFDFVSKLENKNQYLNQRVCIAKWKRQMQLVQKLCLSIQLFIKKGLTISTKGKDKQKGINHIMPVDLAINHYKFNILHLK